MELNTTLATIARQLDQISSGELGSQLDEATLAAFEADHGIELPKSYRAFLQSLGNGGPGPGQGLLRLSGWDTALDERVPDGLKQHSPLDPSKGFDDYDDVDDPAQGAICLAENGGPEYVLLIVSGPRRGRLCLYNADSFESMWIMGADGRFPDMVDWYAGWVHRRAAGLPTHGYGRHLMGPASALARAALDRSLPAKLRARATASLVMHPEQRATLDSALPALAEDVDPRIRSAAMQAAHQARIVGWTDLVAGRLQDQDVGVRREAVQRIADAEQRSTAALREALGDPDDDIARYALQTLDDRGLIDAAALGELMHRPGLRRIAIVRLARRASPDAEPLLTANHQPS